MKKVLLIEDNADSINLVTTILEILELEVIEANNGLVGLELAREHQPDLIISDIDLPELNGFGILEELKRDPLTAEIPFIFLTARTDADDRDYAFQLGTDAFITKPFKMRNLIVTIAQCLNINTWLSKNYFDSF